MKVEFGLEQIKRKIIKDVKARLGFETKFEKSVLKTTICCNWGIDLDSQCYCAVSVFMHQFIASLLVSLSLSKDGKMLLLVYCCTVVLVWLVLFCCSSFFLCKLLVLV